MIRELINERRKNNRNLWVDYKNKLQKELEEYCEELCGHNFMPWKDDTSINVGGHIVNSYVRICWNCDKRIYKRKENLEILEVSEDLFKLSLTERGRSVDTYFFGNLVKEVRDFHKDELLVIKTESREKVAYVSKIFDDGVEFCVFR